MVFDFNLYSSLLLPAFIQGVLFFFLLATRGIREERLSDKLLAWLLLVYTIRVAYWMLGFAGWFDSHDRFSVFMFYFPFNHGLATGPLVYLYFLSLTNKGFSLDKKQWLHFIPEGLYLLRMLYVFVMDVVVNHWLTGAPMPHHYGTQGELQLNGLGWVDDVLEYGSYLAIIAYSVFTLRSYRGYRRYINQHFSDTDKIGFTWLRNLLMAFIAGYLVWVSFSIVQVFTGTELPYIQSWYSFFFLGVLIYYLSIEGYLTGVSERRQAQLAFEPDPEVPRDKLPEQALPTEVLLRWMDTKKPFLDPELTLSELAGQLKTNPAVLSRAINAGLGKNFNDFVNEYRVENVKKLLPDPQFSHLSLLGIAFESGFNSKATFNRVFKKMTGVSPSAFLQGQQKANRE